MQDTLTAYLKGDLYRCIVAVHCRLTEAEGSKSGVRTVEALVNQASADRTDLPATCAARFSLYPSYSLRGEMGLGSPCMSRS